MATGISQLLEKTTDEVLSCGCCHQEFQSPDRLPLDLPCHHAVCQQCVQQLLSKDEHARCPGCEESIPVRDALPKDTARLRLGYLKKILKDKGEILCEICLEKPASSRCQECEELLCEECCRCHRRVTLTRKHTLVSMTEALDKNPANLLKWTEKCREHEKEELKFYCQKCQKAACSTCDTLHHKGCQMKKLEAVLEEQRKEVGEVTKRLEADISEFQPRASSASLEELDRRHSETRAKVQKLFAEGRKLLQEREDQVLADLETRVKKARLDLEEQQAKDRTLLSAAQTRLQHGQRVASLGLSSQLLPGPQVELTRTCEELERQAVAPATQVPIYQVDTSKMAELAAVVKEMGKITTETAEMSSAGKSSSSSSTDSAASQPGSQDGSEKEGGPGETWEARSQSTSEGWSVEVELLTVPRGGGAFREHVDQIGKHLACVLEKHFEVQIKSWAPGQKEGNTPVLILFQSQGRPGDEFPAALPQEFRGRSREVVVAVIQDDEQSSAGKDIVPGYINCSGVVNVHVVPLKHELHKQDFSLCPRNCQAVREIGRLFQLKDKSVEEPIHDKGSGNKIVEKLSNTVRSIGENTRSSAQPHSRQSRPSNGTDGTIKDALLIS